MKKPRSEDLDRSSGEARSEVVVHCRSTPSLEPSLLAVFLLPRIRLMAKISNYLTNRGCIHGTHKLGPKAAKGYKGLRQIEEADFID